MLAERPPKCPSDAIYKPRNPSRSTCSSAYQSANIESTPNPPHMPDHGLVQPSYKTFHQHLVCTNPFVSQYGKVTIRCLQTMYTGVSLSSRRTSQSCYPTHHFLFPTYPGKELDSLSDPHRSCQMLLCHSQPRCCQIRKPARTVVET